MFGTTAHAWPWTKADIMDQRIDGSSQKAYQAWFEHFEKEASESQKGAFGGGMGSVGFLVLYRDSIPDNLLQRLCDGYPSIKKTLWETFDGKTPNEIISWGAAIQMRLNPR